MSCSKLFLSLSVLGLFACGVSEQSPNNLVVNSSDAKVATSVAITSDAGTASSDAVPATTSTNTISTSTATTTNTSLTVTCQFAGQFPAGVPETCSPKAGEQNGRFVCRPVEGKLQPACEGVSSTASTVPVTVTKTETVTTPVTVTKTETVVVTVHADAGAPVVSAPTSYCKYEGEYPGTLTSPCSPKAGEMNGRFVCRKTTNGVEPVCETLPVQVVPTITNDAGTASQADSLQTVATPDALVLVNADALVASVDTTPVVTVTTDGGVTNTDTLIASTDTLPVSTDSLPGTCLLVDEGKDTSCSMVGCTTYAVQHCSGGKLTACSCASQNFAGPAVLDCKKDNIGNYTFTLWGVIGRSGVDGNLGLNGAFYNSERGSPSSVCLSGTHNNWSKSNNCSTSTWGPYQTYTFTTASNMLNTVFNFVAITPNGERWADADPWNNNASLVSVAYNTGTVVPAGICQLTPGGFRVTQ